MKNQTTCGFRGAFKKHARKIVLLTILAMMPMMTSCYGHFPLTRAIYRANGSVGSSIDGDRTQRKILQSAVFWVFVIIPVYAIGGIGDALIFNLIEFWTGNTTTIGYHQEHNGVAVAFEAQPDGRHAVLTISRKGNVLARENFIKLSDSLYEVRHADGTLAGTVVRDAQGGFLLNNDQGRTISTIPAGALRAPHAI